QDRHVRIDRKLQADVSNLWGSPHRQDTARLEEGGRVESANVRADIELEYRKKGQYWYSTYLVHFEGDFQLPEQSRDRVFLFPLPSGGGMFSDFRVSVDDRDVTNYSQEAGLVRVPLPSVGAEKIKITYTGRGSDEWWYNFQEQAASP